MSKKRLDLLKRLNYLSNNHCETCPKRSQPHTACIGCEIYNEFRSIGDQLTDEVKSRRLKKQGPMKSSKKESKSAKKILDIKKYKTRKERDKVIREYILENHKKMSMNRMAEMLGINFMTVKSRMIEMGLERKERPNYIYIYYKDGKEVVRGSVQEIADFENVAADTVYGWFYKKSTVNVIKRIKKVD